jgi:U3 small nucleolar RNA-associated protein 22
LVLQEIFQEKDYLNHRYFYKRAYYLACVAAGLKKNREQDYQLSFDRLHGNPLLPILLIKPKSDQNFRVAVILAVPESLFPRGKLLPSGNCIRPKPTQQGDVQAMPKPTPFYNASLRIDGLVTSYLKLQHEATQQCEAYKDACLLGRVWLRQRGLNARNQGGGFGNFEWAVTIALLLRGGGPNEKPAFSSGYSSYQLFKATLQFLASKDLSKSAHFVGGEAITLPKSNGAPILFDAARGLNIVFQMTPWSYRLLQQEARATMAMLNDSTFDHFDAAFIFKTDNALCRYDVSLEITVSSLIGGMESNVENGLIGRCRELHSVLTRGLTDRVKLVSLGMPPGQDWDINSSFPGPAESSKIHVGFVVDPANVQRLVDHGPSAEDKKAATAFRKFWGEKAELRRFKDGSILESIVWSSKEFNGSIFEQVVSHILSRHFGESCLQSLAYIGDQDIPLLASYSNGASTNSAQFQPVMTAFQTLESNMRGLEDLPLQLRHVLGADSQLYYGSLETPFTPTRTRMSAPANVVIQFEGSARWPDDLDAIQRTKIAFLLKLAESMEEAVPDIMSRIGLENQDSPLLNQAFLDLIYPSGAAFRLRIHHDREATLLERRLKEKSLTSMDKTETALALATYKRDFIRQPAHTQAMQILCTRFPALSPTIRLMKKWVSSHLLSPYFSPSLIDLVVARTFTNPYPWTTPSSATTGFVRTLLTLSRWDWRNEPWIVDLGAGEMKTEEVAAITTRFEAWRNIDPALNRVVMFAASNIDADGTTWTDHGKPPKVIAARLTALAKAAVSEVKDTGLSLDIRSLFVSTLGDYDVLIRLNTKFSRQLRTKKETNGEFKNLQLQLGTSKVDSETVGYNPYQLFLRELKLAFGQALVFFYDENGGDVIAGLWNPQTETRAWKLKLGYSTKPVKAPSIGVEEVEGGGPLAQVNKAAILNEIARLGGDLVSKIEVKDR